MAKKTNRRDKKLIKEVDNKDGYCGWCQLKAKDCKDPKHKE